MARILIAFYNGKTTDPSDPDAVSVFYDAFIRGLSNGKNRIKVYPHAQFGVKDWGGPENMPESILADIRDFDPELCIFFNNAFFDLTDVVECPIFVYSADSPLYYSNKDRIRKNPDRYYYNAYSTMKEVLVESLDASEDHIIEYLPFTGVVREDLPFRANISFIGSKFTKSEPTVINQFMETDPDEQEIREYRNCIQKLIQNPYLRTKDLIVSREITSPKVEAWFRTDQLRWLISDEKRINVLRSIADLGLDLYGTENWRTDYYHAGELNLSYRNRVVMTLAQNQEVYNTSRIGISVGHIQAVDGFPWRTLDIMASAACLVTDDHADFARYFPGLEFPIYQDAYEAREICKELLGNEDKRQRIVRQCNAFVQEEYPFAKITDEISRITGVAI